MLNKKPRPGDRPRPRLLVSRKNYAAFAMGNDFFPQHNGCDLNGRRRQDPGRADITNSYIRNIDSCHCAGQEVPMRQLRLFLSVSALLLAASAFCAEPRRDTHGDPLPDGVLMRWEPDASARRV